MASDYPGGIDSFDTIASDKKTSDSVGGRTHRAMHNDLGDAIEAVQTELGTDPSGTYSTVKARFEAIEGSTLPQVDAKGDLIVGTADNTYDNLGVGTNDTVLLAASGETKGVKWAQVPTAAIQDGAVTPAKLATSGRFTFPTGAANGYGFASGAVHLSGTGSPEGVVTAAPGSTWLQTDATNDVKGWIKWVKATGTGNTGWVAGPEADTGLRDLSGLLTNGWTVSTVIVGRRVGNVVTIDMQALSGAAATADGFISRANLKLGVPDFSGSFAAVGHITNAYNGTTPMGVYYSSTTQSLAAHSLVVTAGWGRLTYITDEAWPSSLPGSAA